MATSQAQLRKPKPTSPDVAGVSKTVFAKESSRPISWTLGLLSDTISCLVSWVMIMELLPSIWFFPMNYLDVTGYEVILGVIFSPCLLGISAVRRMVDRFPGMVRLLSLVGLLSFYAPDHLSRTVMLAAGVFLDLLLMPVSMWWAADQKRERAAWANAFALAISVIMKLGFTSLDPVWMSGPYNSAFVVAGVLAALWITLERSRDSSSLESRLHEKEKSGGTQWVLGSASFGCLFFLAHFLFSSHGVIPRWTNLAPVPYGLLVLPAMVLGMLLSSFSLVTHVVWGILGACSLAAFWYGTYHVPHLGLAAGLFLGIFVFSIYPSVMQVFGSTSRIGSSMAMMMLTYLLLTLASIWVVAYKFVPVGGDLLREAQHYFLGAIALVLLCQFVRGFGAQNNSVVNRRFRAPSSAVLAFLLLIIAGGFAPAAVFRLNRVVDEKQNTPSAANSDYPSHVLSAMIWTVHFGYDNFGRANFDQLASLIRAQNTKVVGLLETDIARHYYGNHDLVEWLGEELHMYTDYGSATSENTWGCAILSAYPFVSVNRTILPSPEGELACLVDAVVSVDGRPVRFLVSHFGNTEDVLDRQLQSEGLRDIARRSAEPVVVLSYLTTRSNGPNFQVILESGLKDTSTDPTRYCQYILYKGLDLQRFQRVDSGDISDTEAQVGIFTLPAAGGVSADRV